MSEAVGEASTGLEGLVGAVSAELAVASVAGAGLLASVLVAGLAFVSSGLRTFSTGAAGLAVSTVSAATWPCARKAKRTAVERLSAFVYKRFL